VTIQAPTAANIPGTIQTHVADEIQAKVHIQAHIDKRVHQKLQTISRLLSFALNHQIH
jgi:hypothetical protein